LKKQNTDSEYTTGKPTPPVAPVEVVDVDKRLKTWFPEMPAGTIARLVTYHTELLRFNKTINLISASTVKNADSVHVADAVLASKFITPSLVAGKPLYDFGSGNGCPGVIYVDRDERKMEFCKHVASAMKLENVSILVKGVEDIESNAVSNAISRGFAPFSRALLLCRKQFPKGGRFFHMKSDGWANELAQLPSQVFTHWTPSLLGQYRLPETTTEMYVVMTEKTSD
jgi:16S rRNA (guanine527-N7)-methyltransferase